MAAAESLTFAATALSWAKPSFDEIISGAVTALQEYVDDPQEKPQGLNDFAQAMKSSAAVLGVMQVPAAAILAEQMAMAARQLGADAVEDRDAMFGLLFQAIVQLPDYLEYVATGRRDVPDILAPLINALRQASSLPALAPSALFFPPPVYTRPPQALRDEEFADPDQMAERATYLDTLFQGYMMRLLADDGDLEAAEGLSAVCEQAAAAAPQTSAAQLFWAAAACFDAVQSQAISITGPARHALFAIAEEVTTITDASRSRDALLDAVLFVVASTPKPTQRLLAVRRFFLLDELIPSPDDRARAAGAIAGRNMALIESVSTAMREIILKTRDALDLHLRMSAQAASLAPQVEALSQLAATIGMLGLTGTQRQLLVHRDLLAKIVAGHATGKEVVDAALMDLAAYLLVVDESLVSNRGVFFDPNVSMMTSIVAAATDTLIREVQASFAVVRRIVAAASADVSTAAPILSQIERVNAFVGLNQASPHFLILIEFLSGQNHALPPKAVTLLAEAVSALEYHIEAVHHRQPHTDAILEMASSRIKDLVLLAAPASDGSNALEMPDPEPAAAEDAAQEILPAADLDQEQPVLSAAQQESEASDDHSAAPAPQAAAPTAEILKEVQEARDQIAWPDLFALATEPADDEISEIFIEELTEEVAAIATLSEKLRQGQASPEEIKDLRRSFHTIKGSGRMVGASVVAELAWSVEQVYNRIMDGRLQPDRHVADLTNSAQSIISAYLQKPTGRNHDTEVKAAFDLSDAILGVTQDRPPALMPVEPAIPQEAPAIVPPVAPKLHPAVQRALDAARQDAQLVQPDLAEPSPMTILDARQDIDPPSLIEIAQPAAIEEKRPELSLEILNQDEDATPDATAAPRETTSSEVEARTFSFDLTPDLEDAETGNDTNDAATVAQSAERTFSFGLESEQSEAAPEFVDDQPTPSAAATDRTFSFDLADEPDAEDMDVSVAQEDGQPALPARTFSFDLAADLDEPELGASQAVAAAAQTDTHVKAAAFSLDLSDEGVRDQDASDTHHAIETSTPVASSQEREFSFGLEDDIALQVEPLESGEADSADQLLPQPDIVGADTATHHAQDGGQNQDGAPTAKPWHIRDAEPMPEGPVITDEAALLAEIAAAVDASGMPSAAEVFVPRQDEQLSEDAAAIQAEIEAAIKASGMPSATEAFVAREEAPIVEDAAAIQAEIDAAIKASGMPAANDEFIASRPHPTAADEDAAMAEIEAFAAASQMPSATEVFVPRQDAPVVEDAAAIQAEIDAAIKASGMPSASSEQAFTDIPSTSVSVTAEKAQRPMTLQEEIDALLAEIPAETKQDAVAQQTLDATPLEDHHAVPELAAMVADQDAPHPLAEPEQESPPLEPDMPVPPKSAREIDWLNVTPEELGIDLTDTDDTPVAAPIEFALGAEDEEAAAIAAAAAEEAALALASKTIDPAHDLPKPTGPSIEELLKPATLAGEIPESWGLKDVADHVVMLSSLALTRSEELARDIESMDPNPSQKALKAIGMKSRHAADAARDLAAAARQLVIYAGIAQQPGKPIPPPAAPPPKPAATQAAKPTQSPPASKASLWLRIKEKLGL